MCVKRSVCLLPEQLLTLYKYQFWFLHSFQKFARNLSFSDYLDPVYLSYKNDVIYAWNQEIWDR